MSDRPRPRGLPPDMAAPAYRVPNGEPFPDDRIMVTCVRCGAVYAVEPRPDTYGPMDPPTYYEAQKIMRAEGHGAGGWCGRGGQLSGPWGQAARLLDDLETLLEGMELPAPDAWGRTYTLADTFGQLIRGAETAIRSHYEMRLWDEAASPVKVTLNLGDTDSDELYARIVRLAAESPDPHAACYAALPFVGPGHAGHHVLTWPCGLKTEVWLHHGPHVYAEQARDFHDNAMLLATASDETRGDNP